jgi:hypothetical protein
MKRNLVGSWRNLSIKKSLTFGFPTLHHNNTNVSDNEGRLLPQTPSIKQQQPQQNRRFVFTSAKQVHIPLRRVRKPFGQLKDNIIAKPKIDFGDLELPYEHGEASIDDYLKKTSLSPWVPMPDSAARKMLDLAAASTSDFHVDLGSGDGRVN